MKKRKNNILVVEPDSKIQKMMRIILDRTDFVVQDCFSAKQAIFFSVSLRPDLILLEADLPDMKGIDFISSVREWSDVPIIVLSSSTEDQDVVEALNRGANDYVLKPFSANILLARIHVALRGASIRETGKTELVNGSLRMDLVRHEVFLDNDAVSLTPKEYDLLRYFMVHCGKMLSHRELLKEIWGDAHVEDTQYLRAFISQIRKKIEKESFSPVRIVTKNGVGYRMNASKTMSPYGQDTLKLMA